MSSPITTIVIGNPGVGKSTLLNCLMGQKVFQSGVSFGGGLTQVAQRHAMSQVDYFVDTPGLSDPIMRKQAAIEIEKSLKEGGLFKVIFVLTLEAGRVKPDDKATIKLVLNSAPQIGNAYLLIINKVPKNTVKKILENNRSMLELAINLNEGMPGTASIYYNINYEELEDEDNRIVALDPALVDVVKRAPITLINPENVRPIDFENFEKERAEIAQQLDELKKDKALLQSKIELQERWFQDNCKQQEELHKKERKKLKKQQQQERKDRELLQQRELDQYRGDKNVAALLCDQIKLVNQRVDKLEAKTAKFNCGVM